MIGVDTNILARACLEDDPKDSEIAKKLLSALTLNKSLFVSSYALLELVWVLKVKGVPRDKISNALLNLLDSPGVIIGQRDCISKAIELYMAGKADFGDYLILAEGETNNTHQLATFDKVLFKENKHCHPPKDFLS